MTLRKRFYKSKRPKRVKPREIGTALEHINRRVRGEIAVEELKPEIADDRKLSFKDKEQVRKRVLIAQALYESGRSTLAQYVMFVAMPIEAYHDEQVMRGVYRVALDKVSRRIRKVERAHGLKSDEHWPLGEGPPEYIELNEQWDALFDSTLVEVFNELAPKEIADIRVTNKARFDALREQGRRNIFHADDRKGALADLIEAYESEISACETAGALYSACVMLGAACEARLLLQCLQRSKRAVSVASKLGRKVRPTSNDPETWTLNQLVLVAAEADWLPMIDDGDVVHVVSAWAHRLRRLRNLLHPGRHIVDHPHVRIGDLEFQDAKAAYTALTFAMSAANRRARKK